jgi:methyl-accepting chemotaxis protein
MITKPEPPPEPEDSWDIPEGFADEKPLPAASSSEDSWEAREGFEDEEPEPAPEPEERWDAQTGFDDETLPPPIPDEPQQTETEPPSLEPAVFERQKVRFGLFPKIMIVMLTISLVPLGVFWLISYRETSNLVRKNTAELYSLTAESLGQQVDNWVESNIWVLRAAANHPNIQSMSRPLQEPLLREIHKKYPYMYLVFTVGIDGRNIARSDDVPLKDYSDRQYYKDIIQGKRLSWQNLIGKTSKQPALVIALPIENDGQLVGVMAAAMTIDDISRYVARWQSGETGKAFLLDEKGKVVAHPSKAFVEVQKNLSDHPLISAFRQKKWTTHTMEFTENSESYFGHVRRINREWAIALQQSTDEVFGPLKKMQQFAYILLGATILIVVLIAWIMARAIVTPIKTLTGVAERMSLGDLNMQINIPSRDEIGLLAQAIKRMQTSLRMAIDRLRRKKSAIN